MTRVRRLNPSSLTRRRRIQSGPGPLKRNDNNRSDPNRASRIIEHQNIRIEKIRQNNANCDEIHQNVEEVIHLVTIHDRKQSNRFEKQTQQIEKNYKNPQKTKI